MNSGLLIANYACACITAVLKDSFSNPFLDFAFDFKSEIRILKSESRFPNRMHPLLLSSTALGKMLPGTFENNGVCKIWGANRVYF